MGTIIIKEAQDVDYYVGWSSVVDAPVWTGNREETLAYLRRNSDPYLRDDAPHHPERRLERADATGTTSLWVTKANAESAEFAAHGYVEEGCWEDDDFIYEQRGILTRANVFVLAHRLDAGNEDAADLIQPFEDSDPDEAPAASAAGHEEDAHG